MTFIITGVITLLALLTIALWAYFAIAVEDEESEQKIRIHLILASISSIFLVATIGQTVASCSNEEEIATGRQEIRCPKIECETQSGRKDTAVAAEKGTDW